VASNARGLTAPFVVAEPDLVALDAPSHFGDVDQIAE
jgi:hypothetical protein